MGQWGKFWADLKLTQKSCAAKKSEQSKLKNLPQVELVLQQHSNFQLFAIVLS